MDQKIREMQERLDKVGKTQPVVPVKENVDRSAMEARLNNALTPIKTSSGLPERIITVPVAKSAPIVAVEPVKATPAPKVEIPNPVEPIKAKSIQAPAKAYQAKPEALPIPPAKPSSSTVPDVPIEKPYQPIENELTSTYSTVPDAVEAPRSSWILWVGIALFVAIVIAQLIWVMS